MSNWGMGIYTPAHPIRQFKVVTDQAEVFPAKCKDLVALLKKGRLRGDLIALLSQRRLQRGRGVAFSPRQR